MEPTKKYGKIREQIEKETIARVKYEKKWGDLVKPELNQFYNQTFLNEEIKKHKEYRPYEYVGHGDSYFLSKDMHKSLISTCRCGRPKTGIHVTKCLQKVKNEQEQKQKNIIKNCLKWNTFEEKLPETSSAIIGRIPSRYNEWERVTHYISPKYTMPGYKISDRPYSVIFIG